MLILDKTEALQISRDIFKKWNKSLQTGDPIKVAQLYTESNMFLPTLSGNFEFGRDGDIEYFEHFLKKKPFGKIIKDDVRIGEKFIVHAGMYDFEVDSENNNRRIVKARFTFVYTKDNYGEWKIIHHHSSLKPNIF